MFSISRDEVHEFIRSLGADPNDVRSIDMDPFRITVTEFRKDEQGQPVIDDDGLAVEVVTEIAIGDYPLPFERLY